MSVFSFSGVLRGSVSFAESAATCDHRVDLPSVGLFDYVALFCTLPPNGGGVLFGVSNFDN